MGIRGDPQTLQNSTFGLNSCFDSLQWQILTESEPNKNNEGELHKTKHVFGVGIETCFDSGLSASVNIKMEMRLSIFNGLDLRDAIQMDKANLNISVSDWDALHICICTRRTACAILLRYHAIISTRELEQKNTTADKHQSSLCCACILFNSSDANGRAHVRNSSE